METGRQTVRRRWESTSPRTGRFFEQNDSTLEGCGIILNKTDKTCFYQNDPIGTPRNSDVVKFYHS